jgi:hypothetical protein
MHFPVHFLLDLLLVVAATASPIVSDSDSSEQPSPDPLPQTRGGKTIQALETIRASPPTLTGTSSEEVNHERTIPAGSGRGGKLERVFAQKMLDLANSGGSVVTHPNSASFPDDDEEEMNQPDPPVLREFNPKRPASPTSDTDSASLPAAKRRMVSESAARARVSSQYHLAPIDPATATVSNIYQEWSFGIFGGIPLSQVDVATQEWQNDPEMLLQYRIRRSIGNAIIKAPQRKPQYSEIELVANLQRFLDGHNPSTFARLAAYLEMGDIIRVYGDLANGLTFPWTLN